MSTHQRETASCRAESALSLVGATTSVRPVFDSIVADQVRRIRDESSVPNIAWAVIDGDDVHAGAIGPTASRGTAFRIASMTKSFTAALVLALRDAGRLALDVPVANYAPELAGVAGPPGSAAITLRHLLSMSAGMATDDPWADRHLDASPAFVDEVYGAGVEFAHLVGEAFEYSNLGFGMIGRVVERVTGHRVRELVDEMLLGPLGMGHTTWEAPAGTAQSAARPHVRVGEKVLPDDEAPLGYGEISPMGGLWSTVDDLAIWMRWLDRANSVPDDDAGPLSAASRREMQTMHTYAGSLAIDGKAAPSGYGFGLLMRDDATCGMIAGHSGGLPGFGSNMRWMKGTGVGVVALGDVTYAPMSTFTMRVLWESMEAGLMTRRTHAVDRLLAERAEQFADLVNNWSAEAARRLFADNVAADEPLDLRRARLSEISTACGQVSVLRVRPTARTHGEITLVGPSGSVDATIHLSPVAGGRVQSYSFGGIAPH